MRSERFAPVSDILPCISATVIVPNYTTTLSAEQLSVLLPTGKARERVGREETGKGRSGGEKRRAEQTVLFEIMNSRVLVIRRRKA